MTEKNIFAYKLFLSLIIWDFNLFFMWKLQPPWKRSPPSFPAIPSRSWDPVKPAPFENLVGGSTSSSPWKKGGGGLHTMQNLGISSERTFWMSSFLAMFQKLKPETQKNMPPVKDQIGEICLQDQFRDKKWSKVL